jgi:hypothetical protein
VYSQHYNFLKRKSQSYYSNYFQKEELPSEFNNGFSKSHEEIVKYHNQIKEHNYISCWTTEKDSMAMWLLYSKEKNSFRIRTTKAKLKESADSFMTNNHWTKHIKSKEGTIQSFLPVAEIKNVEYVNIDEAIEKIKDLHKEERKNIKSLDNLDPFTKIWKDKYRIIKESTIKKAEQIISNPIFLKDKAYQFENEARVLLDIGLRNNLTEKEFKENNELNNIDYVMGTATMDFSDSRKFPNILEIDIDSKFIDEICIDPRMPKYQQNIFKEILNISDIFVTSNIFGCVTDKIDLNMNYFGDYG